MELVDSTTGLPKTGVVYTDVTGSYVRTRSARVAITIATLASASASFSSGGFILIDDTNQPGVYRVDVPDAAFATGAQSVVVTIKATGCRTVSRLFNLVDVNNQVAYAPNVAAGGVGGLLTAPTTANIGLANVTQIGGDTQSLADLKDFADAGYDPTANTVTAVLDSASRLAIWNTLTTETFTADSFGDLLIISDGTNGRAVKVTGAHHVAADVHDCQADGLSGSTEISNIENASGYLLAVLAGACGDPQTASETYAITVFGSTFTVDMAGQTSTGTRTAPTLTKT